MKIFDVTVTQTKIYTLQVEAENGAEAKVKAIEDIDEESDEFVTNVENIPLYVNSIEEIELEEEDEVEPDPEGPVETNDED